MVRLIPAALAVGYAVVVIGTRLTTVAALGTHEAFHRYWEGSEGYKTTWNGDIRRDLVLDATTEVDPQMEVPHVLARGAGWLAAGCLLLPALILGYIAVRDDVQSPAKQPSARRATQGVPE